MNNIIEFQKLKESIGTNQKRKKIKIPVQNHISKIIDTVELKDGFLIEVQLNKVDKRLLLIMVNLYHKMCEKRVNFFSLVQPVQRVVNVAEIWERVFEGTEDQLESLIHQYKEAFITDKPVS